jgi:hypothetical protein
VRFFIDNVSFKRILLVPTGNWFRAGFGAVFFQVRLSLWKAMTALSATGESTPWLTYPVTTRPQKVIATNGFTSG